LVEQPIRNRQVIGSSPIVGSILPESSFVTLPNRSCCCLVGLLPV
jgi:hypothetical protein